MEQEFCLPKAKQKRVVVTVMMREMINRTLAAHALSALIVWYGQSRVGKTTTAGYLVDWLNRQFAENVPDAFRAIYYQTGRIDRGYGNEEKRAIRGLYQAALRSQIDEGFYTRNTSEALAAQLVHGLRRKRVELVVIDEAGRLSAEAIRGINLVRDVAAEQENWRLTIVFVGMDDLPQKMIRYPQIHKRIHEWCYFSEYDLDGTWLFLSELHPFFKKLDAKKRENRELVEVIHELSTGLPGLLVPLLQQLDHRLTQTGGQVTPQFVRAVHKVAQDSMLRSLNESRKKYKPVVEVRSKNKKEKSGDDSKGGGKKAESGEQKDSRAA